MRSVCAFWSIAILMTQLLLPVQAKAAVTVAIDPGHGGEGDRNLGAQYNGFSEKEITLKTALAMRDELQRYDGVRVVMTRDTDREMSLQQRVDAAVEGGADILYCLHYNSSIHHQIYGSEVWISRFPKEYRNVYPHAYAVLDELQGLGFFRRGIKVRTGKKGDYYGILRLSREQELPCVLVEHAHLDQLQDVNRLHAMEDPWTTFGKADARACARALGLVKAGETAPQALPAAPAVKAALDDDQTSPEVCEVVSVVPDLSSQTLSVLARMHDAQSPILYYAYSLNQGRTWSGLIPWNSDAAEQTLTLANPGNAAHQIMLRAHNMYDKEADSVAFSF